MVLLQKPRRSFHKGENHVKFYPINVLGISGAPPVSFVQFVHLRMKDLNCWRDGVPSGAFREQRIPADLGCECKCDFPTFSWMAVCN